MEISEKDSGLRGRIKWSCKIELTGLFWICSLQDTAEYVAYVAKDPVNQRGEVCEQLWVGPVI